MRIRSIVVTSLLAANAAILLSPVLFEATAPAPSAQPAETEPIAQPTRASAARPASAQRRELPALAAVETPEQIAAMPRAQIEAIVAEIDGELARSGAVERLNQEIATPEERQHYGVQLERISLMRNQLARLELQALERAVAEYEAGHAERVAQYLSAQN